MPLCTLPRREWMHLTSDFDRTDEITYRGQAKAVKLNPSTCSCGDECLPFWLSSVWHAPGLTLNEVEPLVRELVRDDTLRERWLTLRAVDKQQGTNFLLEHLHAQERLAMLGLRERL